MLNESNYHYRIKSRKTRSIGGFCGIIFLIFLVILTSTIVIISSGGFAESKTFQINGKDVVVEPYGWGNKDVKYNENVLYEANTGNVILSCIFFESIIVPVYLTGYYLYEPVKLKEPIKVDKIFTWTPSDSTLTLTREKRVQVFIKSLQKKQDSNSNDSIIKRNISRFLSTKILSN